jgi:hypothetical protein
MHMHLNIASVAQPFSKDNLKKKVFQLCSLLFLLSFLDC